MTPLIVLSFTLLSMAFVLVGFGLASVGIALELEG